MDKGAAGGNLFANDGSFMERFKQLQQQQQEKGVHDVSGSSRLVASAPKPGVILNKRPLEVKSNEGKKASIAASGSGKLAFSLKPKSKVVVTPVKLGVDEEEEEEVERDGEGGSGEEPLKRQRLGLQDAASSVPHQGVVAPSPPSDPEVKKVADKLASFVAKNGRQFENITRQRNPGDTPFKFLFDSGCCDYKYYEYRLSEEEKVLAETKDSQASRTAVNATAPRSSSGLERSTHQQHSNFQSHAPALYGSDEEGASVGRNSAFAINASAHRSSNGSQSRFCQQPPNYQTPASALYGSDEDNASVGRHSTYSEPSGPPTSDPIAMMEYYAKKAAQEERKRPPKHSKDEMPPPASLQVTVKKGHHMGDYIPPDELEKFLSNCSGAAAQKAAEKAKIQADNIGHKLLSRMGWKEGEGLGSDKSGRADPVMAGNVKKDNLGIGARQPGEVTAEDDIYEQYKKRMMLGYRYRPNPLNNPRKAYY